MRTFATDEQPLRCSALPGFTRCALSLVLKMVDGDTAGAAAHTGSAVHHMVCAFHTHARGDAARAMATLRDALALHPLADGDAASEQFRRYSEDPRNARAEIVACEAPVRILLAPAEEDPTQAPIVIVGTLDQVRRERGRLVLWDVKTGSPDGADMVVAAAMQLAAYQVGATQLLGEPVRGAGVIRTKDYLRLDRNKRPKPGPVFWETPWEYTDLPALMLTVRRRVAEVRMGRATATPNEGCRWCVGLNNCLGRLPCSM